MAALISKATMQQLLHALLDYGSMPQHGCATVKKVPCANGLHGIQMHLQDIMSVVMLCPL
jgi:hypothetical protein